ncbi:hypothetical protein Tco_0441262 [Tanacetum coccineum]
MLSFDASEMAKGGGGGAATCIWLKPKRCHLERCPKRFEDQEQVVVQQELMVQEEVVVQEKDDLVQDKEDLVQEEEASFQK